MSSIIKLKSVEEVEENRRVILRMDLDLPMTGAEIEDDGRLRKSVPTIRLLIDKGCKIAIVGHRGRPNGIDPELSLKPIYLELMSILEGERENIIENVFAEDFEDEERIKNAWLSNQILFFENSRFWQQEKEGRTDFLMKLVGQSDVFVNDALAVAHRSDASILLHRQLPAFYGLDFVEEVEKMGKLKMESNRPVTLVLGGAKEDKLKYLPELAQWAEKILVGGKLPQLIRQNYGEKVIIGKLKENGLDIDQKTAEEFGQIIADSKTVVWAGAMGKYEEAENRAGTDKIAMAVAGVDGYKVVAGGDTIASIKNMGLSENIDFFVTGGGVLLEFLAKESLPAWE